MKTAMMLAGLLKSNRVRPPINVPTDALFERIRETVDEAGLLAGRGLPVGAD